MSKIITVLLVDDHPMVRRGLGYMLGSMDAKYKFDVTEAGSGEEAVRRCRSKKFDIVIMDYKLPSMNGLFAAKRILKNRIDSKIFIISNYDEKNFVEEVLQAGVMGFALKSIDAVELIKAIDRILKGERYCSKEILEKVFSEKAPLPVPVTDEEPKTSTSLLTEREKEVLKLIVQGHTSDNIAKIMKLSIRTVGGHRQNILYKLNVKNTAEAITYAMKNRLI